MDIKFAAEAAEKGAAVLVVEDEVEVPDSVTVIKVDNTRYAMALISAAWFGYPAEELTTISCYRNKGQDNNNLYGEVSLRGGRT